MLNFKYFIFQVYCTFIFLTILKPNVGYSGRKYTKEVMLKLREEVREMFNHAYSGYLKYAYPYDELRPLTCDGVDTWGSYSLTLIDALDTLAVMGNYSEFRRVVDIVTSKANFDANINVSVFETNIRIVGGLLSAHLLSQRAGVELEPGWPCNGPLLRLAEDVAKRLIAAFDTTTGMPYGTVNLRHGVPQGETSVTCTAGVGTFILEFGTLSRLTGDPIYEEVALNALYALYHHRSSIGLYGNHIDVQTGRWTAQDSGIGAGVDSYLEYLVKGALLVQRPELMAIFNEGKLAIDKHLKRNDWYLWVSMHKGQVTLPVFQSLEAYWPGVLSLIGDISGGMKSMHNYHQVWKQYGFTPEFYNIAQGQVGTNRESYPLRPELIESTMYLYRATKDPFLLDVGMDILRSIQHSAKTKCGYATIKDCRDHSLENRMESFFLAETTKYLYLLFDPENFIHNDGQHGTVHTLPSGRECILDAGGYIFNTEAHPLDPGALLCCSEHFNEPKRYDREAARGEKLTSFAAKHDVVKPPSTAEPLDSVLVQGAEEDSPSSHFPSAFTDTEVPILGSEEFLDTLKESGAVDVVKIPPPSDEEVTLVAKGLEQKKTSLNVLQIIESLVNTSLEKHLPKTVWSQDLLKELVKVIENTEQMLNHEEIEADKLSDTNQNFYHSSKNDPTKETDTIYENKSVSHISKRDNVFHPNSETKTILTEDNIGGNTQNGRENPLLNDTDEYIDSSELSQENEEMRLLAIVIAQQFFTIKKAVLIESDLIMFHLNRCLENLELTTNLIEIANDHELKSQFFTKRLEVMILATEMKRYLEETKKLLISASVKGNNIPLFKRLIDLVVDSKTVKGFVNKYKSYMETVKKTILIGKENYITEQANMNTDEENLRNTKSDMSDSEEVYNNYSNEENEHFFQSNNWKADDISYQVDDRERVTPVSKVDSGPLFTDKLRIKTEAVVELVQNSFTLSQNTFIPQVLLERIRENPRYPRNTTWATQYELLTCLPQPYFTRIMLTGEFYND